MTYVLATGDFDQSLLPAEAREPGTDEFQRAVSDFYTKEYANFGGTVRVSVTPKTITVSWRPDAARPDPMDVAVDALKAGDHDKGVLLLELLRQQHPDSLDVLCNLGMALSDMGRLDVALRHLRHAESVDPKHVSTLVAIGVALARQKRWAEAVPVLERAVALEPGNTWAHRNLGACLLQGGQNAKAERSLRRAVELAPKDQQALFGLAEVLQANDNDADADKLYVRIIDVDPTSDIAEMAKTARSKLAQESMRSAAPGGVRMDAVFYLLDAMQKFGKMDRKQVQQVAFEIAMLGQRGFDTNSPDKKYQTKSLPGMFSGLQMVSFMYAGFKAIDPSYSIGFDLSKEYEAAKAMLRSEKGK